MVGNFWRYNTTKIQISEIFAVLIFAVGESGVITNRMVFPPLTYLLTCEESKLHWIF